MSRTRLITLALLACVALGAASVAAAHSRRAQSTQAAAATFAATSVSHARSTTCTGADGTYQHTVARYDGSSSSGDPRLNGPLTLSAHSVVNTTTGLGWVEGTYRIRGSSGGAHGAFHAAVASGKAAGGLNGSVGRPQGKLVASLASTFSQTGGFGDGALGTGNADGAGVVFQNGACTKTKPPKPVHTVSVAHLDFRPGHHRTVAGSLTLDVTRDSNGAITGANAVFYVNYRLGQSVTISGLSVKQLIKGGTDPVVVDAGTGSIADGDGSGNLTRQVGISGSTAQALLAHPRGYYAELTTSLGTLHATIGGFGRR
jgi:hypothetical protein